ncbi:MAG: hypothetical protein COC15_03020 [Legionellales bacterium]|nr:MAG: hypothetical protein COC15_03020 [Legionellales bacterium]
MHTQIFKKIILASSLLLTLGTSSVFAQNIDITHKPIHTAITTTYQYNNKEEPYVVLAPTPKSEQKKLNHYATNYHSTTPNTPYVAVASTPPGTLHPTLIAHNHDKHHKLKNYSSLHKTYTYIEKQKNLKALKTKLNKLNSKLHTLAAKKIHPAKHVDALKNAKLLDTIAAIVNNGVITRYQLKDAVAQYKVNNPNVSMSKNKLQDTVLKQLVINKIALQLAKLNSIEGKDAEVTRALTVIAKRNKVSLTEFKQVIESHGVNFKLYKQDLRNKIIMHKLQQISIANSVRISQTQIDNFINSHNDKLQHTKYEVANILISTKTPITAKTTKAAKEKIDNIKKQITSGKISFAQAAKKYSSSINASTGGNLGARKLDAIPTVFAPTVKSMHKGEVSGPVATKSGFFLIKLLNKTQPSEKAVFKTGFEIQKITIAFKDVKPSSRHADTLLKKLMQQLSDAKNLTDLQKQYKDNKQVILEITEPQWVEEGKLPKDLAKEIKQLHQGKLSKPKLINGNWNLVKFLNKKTVDASKIMQQQTAYDILFQQNLSNAIQLWEHQLIANSYIKIIKQ